MTPRAVRRVFGKVSRSLHKANSRSTVFDAKVFLNSAGLGRKVSKFPAKEIVFAQGDPAKNVMYIQEGGLKLTVVNEGGKEAVVAILGPGDFFGEGCLAGHSICMASATSIAPTTVLVIEKEEMLRVLHKERELSDRFIAYMLSRNIRVEEDLIDQLFNSSEKRLARALLLLAQFGKEGKPEAIVPRISQETLAEIVGTTRSRVSYFMNKFRRLGFIEYNGGMSIHSTLLNVILYDKTPESQRVE